jgi:hypothetical protein
LDVDAGISRVQEDRAWHAQNLERDLAVGKEGLASGAQGWFTSTMRGVRWESGKEHCYNTKQLRQALKRARAAPLDLAINCRGGYPTATDDRAKEMVEMVAGEHLSQWRSLEFAVEDDWDLSESFSGSLERLTHLRLNSFHRDLYDCLCETARNLQDIEIHMREQPLNKLADAPWWQHVHRLLLVITSFRVSFEVALENEYEIQCNSVVEILSKADELEDLAVQFEYSTDFTPFGKSLHFPRMKKLVLRSCAGLVPTISAPLLTHLEIRGGGWRKGALDPGSICFPAVTHLSVFSSAAPVLASFYCPSLVQLCLGADLSGGSRKSNNDRIVTSAWSPYSDPEKHLKPLVLKIESLAFTWTVLRDVLRFSLHDCLRELSLVDSPLPKSFFKALMAVEPSSVVCEGLETLTVKYKTDIYYKTKVMGWDEGKEILQSIFTLRRERNLGIRKVIAQWPWQWPGSAHVEFSDDSGIRAA